MWDNPARAMRIIDYIHPQKDWNKSLYARYFILKAMALDRNGIDDGCLLAEFESIYQLYYMRLDARSRMLATFYLADQQYDALDKAAAIVNFMCARNEAISLDDHFFAGLASLRLHDAFLEQKEAFTAIRYGNEAVDYFAKAGNDAYERSAAERLKLSNAESVGPSIARPESDTFGYKLLQAYIVQNKSRSNVFLAHTVRLVLLAVIIILILILAALILYVKVSNEKFRARQAEASRKDLSHKMQLYSETVKEVLDFGFGAQSMIAQIHYHPNLDKPVNYGKAMDSYYGGVSSNTRLGALIETNLDVIHDGVMSSLKKELPSLIEDQIRLFSYLALGVPYSVINAAFPKDKTMASTYARVSRLRSVIKESDAAHKDYFLSFLTRKP